MIRIGNLPNRIQGEDPGALGFRVLAATYPDQFVIGETFGIDPRTRAKNMEQDVEGQNQHDANVSSGLFETHRRGVRPLFRALLGSVFEDHNLAREGGIDIGSGATGEMVNQWLPLSDSQRATWVETDVNQQAVQLNRGRHNSGGRARVASMYNLRRDLELGERGVPIITGLSSLDAPIFPEEAIKGVRDALVSGGYLVHVQDVRPGMHMGIDQLKHEGRKTPYRTAQAKTLLHADIVNPHVYFKKDDKLESAVELFRRRLERALKNVGGFDILRNDWVSVEEDLQEERSFIYVMNMRGPVSIRHTQNSALNLAYAVVTVARKK